MNLARRQSLTEKPERLTEKSVQFLFHMAYLISQCSSSSSSLLGYPYQAQGKGTCGASTCACLSMERTAH